MKNRDYNQALRLKNNTTNETGTVAVPAEIGGVIFLRKSAQERIVPIVEKENKRFLKRMNRFIKITRKIYTAI